MKPRTISTVLRTSRSMASSQFRLSSLSFTLTYLIRLRTPRSAPATALCWPN